MAFIYFKAKIGIYFMRGTEWAGLGPNKHYFSAQCQRLQSHPISRRIANSAICYPALCYTRCWSTGWLAGWLRSCNILYTLDPGIMGSIEEVQRNICKGLSPLSISCFLPTAVYLRFELPGHKSTPSR